MSNYQLSLVEFFHDIINPVPLAATIHIGTLHDSMKKSITQVERYTLCAMCMIH